MATFATERRAVEKPTVYVVQEVPGKNILPATEYGELKVMLPHGDVTLTAEPTLQRLRGELAHLTEQDYILLIGDPVAIALATVAANEVVNRLNLLKWDRQTKRYFPVSIILGEFTHAIRG